MHENPVATMTMENGARLVIRLRPDLAPNTVHSFIYLAARGAFDRYPIARIEPGYVVDASTNAFGREDCRYLIENEAALHPPQKRLPPQLGVIAMGGYPQGIAGGEFFFPLALHTKLDGHYPVFGQLLEGTEEILRLGQVPVRPFRTAPGPVGTMHTPTSPQVIATVRVDTFGVVYPQPRRLEAPLPRHWLDPEYSI